MSMPRQQPTIARGSDVKEVLSLTVRLLTEVPLRANKRSGRSFIVTSNGVNRHASPHPSKAVSSAAPKPLHVSTIVSGHEPLVPLRSVAAHQVP
jgi:hypothetical protein